ncbi:MAG: transposase, partial [Succiniclasticum sp.]|nr:transposase [Succiniclasticum sp.]
KIKYRICRRPSTLKKLSRSGQYKARKAEYRKSSVRCKVEHVFGVIKNLFRCRKTRYRGKAKVDSQLKMVFALANLFLADTRYGLQA